MISIEPENLSLLLWVCELTASLSRKDDLGNKAPCQEFHDLSITALVVCVERVPE